MRVPLTLCCSGTLQPPATVCNPLRGYLERVSYQWAERLLALPDSEQDETTGPYASLSFGHELARKVLQPC